MELQNGQKVFWRDPEHKTSGIYTVLDANYNNSQDDSYDEHDDDVDSYEDDWDDEFWDDDDDDDDDDDRIVLIGNDVSEAEVLAIELELPSESGQFNVMSLDDLLVLPSKEEDPYGLGIMSWDTTKDLIDDYEAAGGYVECINDNTALGYGHWVLSDSTHQLYDYLIQETYLNEWSSGYKITRYDHIKGSDYEHLIDYGEDE